MDKPITKEQILSAFQFRHACKAFDPARKISEEDFAFILETGRLSPSSFGFEPWKFVVLQDMRIRERLRQVSWGAQKQLPTASHFVLILARTKAGMMPESPYLRFIMQEMKQMPPEIVQKMSERYLDFLQNDFALFDNERAVFEWVCRQTYIALGNMMTSAAMIGIDSCPIEGFNKEKAERILQEEDILPTDGTLGLSCMVAFGYRVNEPRDKNRQPLDRIVERVGR